MSGRYTGPIRDNCTHIMVSLLKAWKVTVVGIECDVAAFIRHFKKAWKVTVVGIECNSATFLTSFQEQEGPYQKLFFQGFFFKILQVRWQTVLQLSYVITGKLLATHF